MALRADYRDDSKPTVLTSPKVHEEYEHIIKEMAASLQTLSTDKENS